MFDTESPQLPVTTKQRPRTTGDLWNPSAANPTTVPVPLPVVVVRVDGPFTALDRKLWLALVHIAFPDLDKPGKIHEIQIGEIIDLFRKVERPARSRSQRHVAAHEKTEREHGSGDTLAKHSSLGENNDRMGRRRLYGH